MKMLLRQGRSRRNNLEMNTLKLHSTPVIQSLLTFRKTTLSIEIIFCFVSYSVQAPVYGQAI